MIFKIKSIIHRTPVNGAIGPAAKALCTDRVAGKRSPPRPIASASLVPRRLRLAGVPFFGMPETLFSGPVRHITPNTAPPTPAIPVWRRGADADCPTFCVSDPVGCKHRTYRTGSRPSESRLPRRIHHKQIRPRIVAYLFDQRRCAPEEGIHCSPGLRHDRMTTSDAGLMAEANPPPAVDGVR